MQRGDAAAAHLHGRRRRRARVVGRARYRERRIALAETAAGPHRERRAALPARPQLPRAGRQHLPRMCRVGGFQTVLAASGFPVCALIQGLDPTLAASTCAAHASDGVGA